jgi:hypothetical protein
MTASIMTFIIKTLSVTKLTIMSKHNYNQNDDTQKKMTQHNTDGHLAECHYAGFGIIDCYPVSSSSNKYMNLRLYESPLIRVSSPPFFCD